MEKKKTTTEATEEAITSLHDKLRFIQVHLVAPKNCQNNFGNYKYRKAEDILTSLKPYLDTYNLVITIDTDVASINNHYYVVCTATLSDGSGQTISAKALAREDEMQKGMNSSQLTGSCISYAKKYALGNLFAIDNEDDPDSNEFQTKANAAKQQKQTAAKPQPQQVSATEAEQVMLALQEANAAKDRTELDRIWKTYIHLKENMNFLIPFKAICEKFPKPAK